MINFIKISINILIYINIYDLIQISYINNYINILKKYFMALLMIQINDKKYHNQYKNIIFFSSSSHFVFLSL